MMVELRDIYDLKFTGLHLAVEEISEIQIDIDVEIGSGGFGTVYSVANGLKHFLKDQFVVKTFNTAVGGKCHKLVRTLQERMLNYLQREGIDNKAFHVRHPGLLAFPEVSFQATLNGENVYCYLMRDLTKKGFILLEDFLFGDEYEELVNTFYSRARVERYKTAFYFLDALCFLEQELNFIHGDIKAKSIFVNPSTGTSALIDFDGGAALSKPSFSNPQTSGELQDWLPYEILKKFQRPNEQVKHSVSWASEYWSAAIGAFIIINKHHPFEYLMEKSAAHYEVLGRNKAWPSYDFELEDYFDENLSDKNELLVQIFRENLSRELFEKFNDIFNLGILKVKKRSSFAELKDCMAQGFTEDLPDIVLKMSKKRLLEGDSFEVKWSYGEDVLLLFESNVLPASGKISIVANTTSAPYFDLISPFGNYKKKLPIEVVRKLVIRKVGLLNPASVINAANKIFWEVEHSSKITVRVNGKEYDCTGSSDFDFISASSETITVRFVGRHGLDIQERKLDLCVVEPVKFSFVEVDRPFTAETLPVKIQWAVQNATKVILNPGNIDVTNYSEYIFRPSKTGEYTLTGSNSHFKASQVFYIEVLPVPRIQNLRLPKLPDLDVTVPPVYNSASLEGGFERLDEVFKQKIFNILKFRSDE